MRNMHADLSDEAASRLDILTDMMAKSEGAGGLRPGFQPWVWCFQTDLSWRAAGIPFEGASWKHTRSRRNQLWRPFRARRIECGNPGLKPWAKSCFPFGEDRAGHRTPNAKRATPTMETSIPMNSE